ncbi:hypothetical protein LWI29_019611 [Acer saccharum]|uniref:S-protein homolog n=1 Tax=Acer saccharum TaxID=4024 RepID=A0AA39VLE1_ACESA|nr:hypothetical protein LWI29_019611 [Acer saccharum]
MSLLPFTKLIISLLIILLAVVYNFNVCNATDDLTPEEFHVTVHVQVINDIGAGSDLTVHCKSKDDDLGVCILPFQQSFEFHFHKSVFSTTQFYCSMAWSGAFKWFDIYIQRRDDSICGKQCVWKIKPTGPCVHNVGSPGDTCYKWNNP